MGGITVSGKECENCDIQRRLLLRRLPIYAAVGLLVYVGYKAIRSRV